VRHLYVLFAGLLVMLSTVLFVKEPVVADIVLIEPEQNVLALGGSLGDSFGGSFRLNKTFTTDILEHGTLQLGFSALFSHEIDPRMSQIKADFIWRNSQKERLMVTIRNEPPFRGESYHLDLGYHYFLTEQFELVGTISLEELMHTNMRGPMVAFQGIGTFTDLFFEADVTLNIGVVIPSLLAWPDIVIASVKFSDAHGYASMTHVYVIPSPGHSYSFFEMGIYI